jgi:hypothetical protein
MKEAILSGFNDEIQKRIIAQSEILRKQRMAEEENVADLVALSSDADDVDYAMGDASINHE